MENSNLISLLHTENCSCVIENRGEIRTFYRRGVIDLYELHETEPDFMKGASLADKIIGKGAAALIIIGGMHQVYADIISTPALNLLQNAGIPTSFSQEVPHIINRQGNGYCPLETLCKDFETPEDMYPIIQGFVEKIRNNN